MLDIKLEQQYIIDLVSYTLFDTHFDFNKYENKELDYKYIATKIHEQKMEGLVYHAMSTLKINNNLYNHLHNRYMTILYTCVQQENEYQELVKLFEANNIDYVPLKGTFMKHYYPKMEMRLMGDIDVLIPSEKKIEVRNLLLQKNYRIILPLEYNNHHEVFQYKYSTFEIHHRLFDEGIIENELLDNLVWVETNNHVLNIEFNITYLVSHYKKHFIQLGASYKSMIDICLLLEKEIFDREKLKKLLKETKNYNFFNNIVCTYNAIFGRKTFCFENTLNDEEIVEINNLLFKCGDFGFGMENNPVKSEMLKNFATKKINVFTKISYLLSRVCLPYRKFKYISKAIKYCPILLPFGWFVRFFVLLLNKKRNGINKFKDVKNVSSKEIKEYKEHLSLIDRFVEEK